ncbi:MAG: DUF4340 domain-containing protein [Candidatus Omnitrophota bacterium]
MKAKNLMILCAVFICLVGLILIKKTVKEEVPTEEVLEMITSPGIALEELDKVKIYFENADKNVEISKITEIWQDTKYGLHADKNALDLLIKSVNELKGEIRSEDGAILPDYGITDEEGLHIVLGKNGEDLRHLIVGTHKPSGNEIFVRFAGNNRVYNAESRLAADLGFWGDIKSENLNTDKWTDKHMFSVDAENISGFKITKKNALSEDVIADIYRKDVEGGRKWESPEEYPFTISASKIKEYLKTLNILTFSKVTDNEDGHFDGDTVEMELTRDNGEIVIMIRGDKDENGINYYVKNTAFNCLFLVPVKRFDNIVKTNGDLFTDDPFGIEKNGLSGMEIRLTDGNKDINISKNEENDQVKWVKTDGTEISKSTIDKLTEALKKMHLMTGDDGIKKGKSILTVNLMQPEKVWDIDILESVTIDSKGYDRVIVSGSDKAYYAETQEIDKMIDAVKEME